MRFTRQEIADTLGATLYGQDGPVLGATVDSRDVPTGALFVLVSMTAACLALAPRADR